MDEQLHEQIDEYVDRLRENLHQDAKQWAKVRTPDGMLELERTLPDLLNSLHTGVVRAVLESIHRDKEFVAECQSQAWEQGLRNVAWREAMVMTLGGEEVKVKTPYTARRRKGKRGRRRKVGKRGKGGSGDYPVLRRLGIVGRATPRLLAEVTRQVADGPSEAEAQERLAGWGIVLDRKTMRAMYGMWGT